jgi:biofilm PGA synthesis N-glycosyltransferase PgaC
MFDDLRQSARAEAKPPVSSPVKSPTHPTHSRPGAPADRRPEVTRRSFYLSVRWKFILSLCAAFAWAAFSLWIAAAWLRDFSALVGAPVAYLVVFGIAIIPGFMNAFLVTGLLLDRRPEVRTQPDRLPPISILVAAYNEEASIASTLHSIALQDYPNAVQVIVVNDGSTDGTAAALAKLDYPWLQVINLERNAGKSHALNRGLEEVRHALTITLDGDSYLYRNALRNLIGRYLSDPPDTRAVAGAVLIRNSRKNLVTKAQEWDYFHGIAAIKRLQSLYQGTLVAQGAFSAYDTQVLREIGGWPHTVGEDIVLTWQMLAKDYRIGFAENACVFTNAPETWSQFVRQRQRWSRGLIEAFKAHWRLLFKARMSTMFIWWNVLFPYMDLVFTLAFIPGLVLALFGIYWIAGPLTLLLLPLAGIVNGIMFGIQRRMFVEQGLKVRRNFAGFLFYSLCYSFVLQPACVVGYMKELLNRSKTWGTK